MELYSSGVDINLILRQLLFISPIALLLHNSTVHLHRFAAGDHHNGTLKFQEESVSGDKIEDAIAVYVVRIVMVEGGRQQDLVVVVVVVMVVVVAVAVAVDEVKKVWWWQW